MTTTSVEKEDGRHSRSKRTIDKLVSTCRQMMVAGIYRPPMVEVARNAGLSVRSGFQYFPALPDLHREALKHQSTRNAIVRNAIGNYADTLPEAAWQRVVDALVFGATVEE